MVPVTTNMDFSIFAPAMDFSGVLATFRSWHGSGDLLNGGSGSYRTSEPTGPAAVVLDRPRGSMVVLWSVSFIGGWSDLLGLKRRKNYGKIQKITIFNG